MSRRLTLSLLIAIGLFVLASGFGWREYVANPTGHLFASTQTPCPVRTHSSGVGLWVALLVTTAAALLIAAGNFGASLVPQFKSAQRLLRFTWQTTLLVIPFLYVLALMQPFIEAILPSQKMPGCV